MARSLVEFVGWRVGSARQDKGPLAGASNLQQPPLLPGFSFTISFVTAFCIEPTRFESIYPYQPELPHETPTKYGLEGNG